jgi:tetratricopeptide (TPR) repeat protein
VSTGVIPVGSEEFRLRMIETKIKEFPQRLEFRLDRTYLLITLKRYEEALAEAETCVKMNFNSAIAYKLKSEALCGLKRYQEALDAITQAIHARPVEQGWFLERDKIKRQLGQN